MGLGIDDAVWYAERDAALLILQRLRDKRRRRITVGADKALRHEEFCAHGPGTKCDAARSRQPVERSGSPPYQAAKLRNQLQPPRKRTGITTAGGVINIEFPGRALVSIESGASPAVVRAIIESLRR